MRTSDVRIVRLLSSGPDLHQGDVPHDAHDTHDPRNASVSLASPVFGVWGSNTGVGKTLISAGLANAFLQQQVLLKRIMALQLLAFLDVFHPVDVSRERRHLPCRRMCCF